MRSRLALTLGIALVLIGSLPAQRGGFRPPIPPPPPIRPPGMPGTGIGGTGIGRGMGLPEKTWHCPKCNRQLGTGLLPPASATCCGTTYVGGHGLPGFNPPPMPANPDPVAPPAPAPVFVAPPAPAPAAAPAASGFSGGMIASIIGIVLFGLFIVAGVAVMIIQNQAADRPSRPRRRRQRDDDDDYDR